MGPQGLLQTTAFEIDGSVVKAVYVVRNPDKLRHLAYRSCVDARTTGHRGVPLRTPPGRHMMPGRRVINR
jgi:hypothetical protein